MTAFDKVHRATSECNAFAATAAKALFQAGDLPGAREAAMKLIDRKTTATVTVVEKERNALLVEIAKAALRIGNDSFSYDCIAPIRSRHKEKNKILAQLGDKELAATHFTEALNYYRQIDDKTHATIREKLLSQLATCCITANEWKVAEQAIKAIMHDEKIKASLLTQLVESCRFTGNLDGAFTMLGHFTIFETAELREEIERLYCPIFASYLQAEDRVNAKKCLKKLIQLILENEFSINGVDRAFKKDLPQFKRINAFSSHLCDTHFDEIVRIFTEGDSNYVICLMRNLVSKHATLEAFKEHFKVEETPPSPKSSRTSFRSKTEGANEKTAAYTLFNLTAKASAIEIKKRYNALRLQYHPDKIIQEKNEPDDAYQERLETSIALFHEISKAYNTLMNN